MIQLTDNAREYLSSIANDDHITLGVKGGGCSGFTYVWDYKKNWPNVNWGKPIEDLLVLDPMAEMFVAGCTIDYVKELGGSYLKVVNPNATASCGCGESFAEYNEKRKRALARKKKQLEKQNEGKVKTTVTEQSNGMKKITKQQGNVSMEYYE